MSSLKLFLNASLRFVTAMYFAALLDPVSDSSTALGDIPILIFNKTDLGTTLSTHGKLIQQHNSSAFFDRRYTMIDAFKHNPDERAVDWGLLGNLLNNPVWTFKHEGKFHPDDPMSLTLRHNPTGTRIVIRQGSISSVTGNLSRLFTGRDDNLHVLQNQQEIDAAMAGYWALLDSISTGPYTGRFMVLEVGGVIVEPFSTFERLLRHAQHPWVQGEVCAYDGRSMAWGRKIYDVLFVRVYDKPREARKHHPGCTDAPNDTYTRLEARLNSRRLFERAFGHEFVNELDFEEIRRAFFYIFLQFNAGQAEPVIQVDGSVYGLEALVNIIPAECRRIEGQDILDLHFAAMAPKTRQRHLQRMHGYKITAGTRSLRQILNPDSSTSILAQIPYRETSL